MLKNLFICICLLPIFLMGQDQSIKFKHLTLEDGLSQSSITSILKDSQGFMWFGTEDGLNRYDGSSFTVYQNIPNDTSSISNSYIYTIVEEEDGFLWIGTKNGLNHYNPDTEKFTRYSTNSNGSGGNDVTALHKDSNGNLLMGTANGLQIFERVTGTIKSITTNNSASTNYIVSVTTDNEENIWLQSSHEIEQIKLNGNSQPLVLFEKSFRATSYNEIFMDSLHLWMGTNKGLLRLDLHSYESKIYTFFDASNKLDKRNTILSICESQPGRLWLGSNGGGLIDFEKATGEFKTVPSVPDDRFSLTSGSITNLLQDESGILWLGTHAGGVNKYDPDQIKFKHYKEGNGKNGLSEESVRSVLRDRDGDLWVGTHGGGLNRINYKTNETEVYSYDENNPATISSNTIRSLQEDSKGNIWAGTWENGLNRYDKQSGKFKRYIDLDGKKDSLISVPALAIDKNDKLWIGGTGLWQLDIEKGQVRRYLEEENGNFSVSTRISSLYLDSSNHLWFGTYNEGLNLLGASSKVIKQYIHNPEDSLSISHNHITCIVEDQKGVLWVGTYGGGINVLDTSNEQFQHYDTRNGLLNNVIYGILVDKDNFVWFSSNAGLGRLDQTTGGIKYFGVNYGIQSNEFNAGAYHKSKDGEIFFGGINGLNAFHPSSIYSSTKSKRIVFTEFQLLDEKKSFKDHESLDKVISRAEEITLQFSQNTFSLKFAELNYSDNTDNNYEYQLVGNEKLWQNLGKNKVITIANLNPGKYQLNLRVQDDLSKKTSIGITVLPPFWKTTWAYLVYLLAFVLITAWTYRTVKKFERTKSDFELRIANWENTNSASLQVKQVPTTSMNQKFVERAIQIVEDNIGDSSFGVEKFMGEMFMSRSQLHRKLKASTGYSTTKFIRYIRLQRAAQLLKGNAGTVAEIAYKVGFENVGYFSKCFSETFGTPPSQYS